MNLPIFPKLPAPTLANPENQGVIITHHGKRYLIIDGELRELSKEEARCLDRFGYYELNYLIRNNLLV